MSNFFNLSIIYGLGFLFLRGISFLLLPIYTNLLSAEDAGVIFLLYTILAFLHPVFAGGLDSALFKFYNSKLFSKEKVISTSLFFLFITSCLLSLMLIGVSTTSIINLIDVHYNWILLLSIILLFDAISARSLVILRLKEKAWYYLLVGFINIVSSLIFNLLFISYYNLSNLGAVYALMATSAIQVVTLIPLISSQINIREVDMKLYKKMLFFGLPFLPATILFITIGMIDRFFIESYLGLADVGLYSAGYKIGSVISIIIIAFNLNWQPYYLKTQEDKNFSINIKKISQIFTIILLYVAVFMCLFSQDLLRIKLFGFYLIGESFWPSYTVIPWVVFGYFFYGLYVLQSPSLYIKNKQKWTPVFWGFGTAINVALNIVLIPKLGIVGAAIATFISYFFMFLFIKLKNKFWMQLPLFDFHLLFFVLISFALLFLKYISQSFLLISMAFIFYSIGTVLFINHFRR